MEHFTQLTIFLVSLIVLARLGNLLAGRIGLPATPFQLLFGILLGPSLLNLLGTPIILGTWGSISPSPLHSVLKILAEIGLIQLMFLAGIKTDWGELKKLMKISFNVGSWGFVLTAGVAVMVTRLFVDRWAEALAVGAIMAASSFGISAYNMSEMRFFGSKASNISTGAAILSGLLAMLLMIAGLTANYAVPFGGFRALIALSWFLGKLVMFFAIAYFLTSRFLKLATKSGLKKSPRQMLIGYLLLVAAIYAWAAMHFGSFAAVPVASLGGALLGMSALGVKEKMTKELESILASILAGVLFIVLGMEVNLKETGVNIIYSIGLSVIVVASKWIGTWVATRKLGDSSSERLTCAAGTLPQGEVGMLIAAYLFSRGLVNPLQFNVSIAVVVLLTMVAPILVRITMKWSLREASPVIVRMAKSPEPISK